MATIRDVSKEAGVSRATVTRALQSPEQVAEKTLQKVQAAIQKLDYRPNMLSQTFRNKRSYTVVVMVPNIANPFFSKIISGIETVAQDRGYNLLLGDTHNSPKLEAHYISLVETQLADGVIQLSSDYDSPSLLQRPHIKAVSIAGASCAEPPQFPTVRIDGTAAAKAAVEHLLKQGHRRIATITGPKENSNTWQRLKGYQSALSDAHIEFDPALVYEGDFRLASGRTAAEKIAIIKEAQPTAIFCMNDEMAIGAIGGLSSAKITVPGDISVMGFDDIDMASFTNPRLTTITQPAKRLGQLGMTQLISLIECKPLKETDIILPFSLSIRDSVSAL